MFHVLNPNTPNFLKYNEYNAEFEEIKEDSCLTFLNPSPEEIFFESKIIFIFQSSNIFSIKIKSIISRTTVNIREILPSSRTGDSIVFVERKLDSNSIFL